MTTPYKLTAEAVTAAIRDMNGNISAVAPGVAEALITTVAGLAVAIPAVIAYNLFVNKLSLFAGEMEGFAYELVGTMAREGLL